MIYLAQTDTTAGFLSKNKRKINKLKKRALNTACLLSMASFKELLSFTRVPNKYKNRVRRARKTSFLYPNQKMIRVVKDHPHEDFLKKMGFLYSSSANLHGLAFDLKLAIKLADKVVDKKLSSQQASKIYKLGRLRLIRLR